MQGNDRGTQYRTGIYYHGEEQRQQALEVIEEEAKKYGEGKEKIVIATEVKEAKVFWPAEPEHQDYLKNGGRFGRSQSADKGCNDKIRCYG